MPYATSSIVLRGYRPLIRTLATELPLPDGDYVFTDQALDGTARLLRTTAMPMLVLWGEKGHVNRSYRPLEAWRERATDCHGRMLACGHYPAEQAPAETSAELRAFFR